MPSVLRRRHAPRPRAKLASRSHAFTRGEKAWTTASCAALHEIVQPNQIADRGKRHVRAHSSAYALPVGYIHVHCTCRSTLYI